MLINPLKTFAQILNFLILIFSLKKFLYKPIPNEMKQRERNLISCLEEAEEIREAAQKESEYYPEKQQEWAKHQQERQEKIKEEKEIGIISYLSSGIAFLLVPVSYLHLAPSNLTLILREAGVERQEAGGLIFSIRVKLSIIKHLKVKQSCF